MMPDFVPRVMVEGMVTANAAEIKYRVGMQGLPSGYDQSDAHVRLDRIFDLSPKRCLHYAMED